MYSVTCNFGYSLSEITVMSYLAGVKLIVCFTKPLSRPNLMLIYYFYFYMAVRSVLIIHYISNLLLNLLEKIFRIGQCCITQNTWVRSCFYCVWKQVAGALFLNALISLPQQVAGLIWKRSGPFLEKLSSVLNKPIKFYRYVENASDFE